MTSRLPHAPPATLRHVRQPAAAASQAAWCVPSSDGPSVKAHGSSPERAPRCRQPLTVPVSFQKSSAFVAGTVTRHAVIGGYSRLT